MKFCYTDPAPIAAAKSGFSSSSAYPIEKDLRLPSQKEGPSASAAAPIRSPMSRGERDRADPRGGARAAAGRHFRGGSAARPAELGGRGRRTLERRIRFWRAIHCPDEEVVFRQVHEPGRRGSVRTSHRDWGLLALTIAGTSLDHRLYQLPPGLFRLRACPRHPEGIASAVTQTTRRWNIQ